MAINIQTALTVARTLLDLAEAAEKDGKLEFDVIHVLQGVDDVARAELQAVIDAAKAGTPE